MDNTWLVRPDETAISSDDSNYIKASEAHSDIENNTDVQVIPINTVAGSKKEGEVKVRLYPEPAKHPHSFKTTEE